MVSDELLEILRCPACVSGPMLVLRHSSWRGVGQPTLSNRSRPDVRTVRRGPWLTHVAETLLVGDIEPLGAVVGHGSISSIRCPIQRITGTAIELPMAR